MAVVLGAVASLAFAAQVSAMTPNLSVVSNNNGTVLVTVTADANSPVILNYYSGYQILGAGIIGYTNYSGYFSTTLNTSSYAIPSGSQVVVMVNGQQSISAVWPTTYSQYPNNTGYNTIPVLNQSNVSLTVGQSQAVTINSVVYYNNNNFFNNNYAYYITNPNSGIVTATMSGNTINLYGLANGSTTLSVCSGANTYGLGNYYNNGNCANLYVTVTGSIYYPPAYPTYPTYPTYPAYPTYPSQPVTLSNNNVQVTVGNTGTVIVYGNNAYNTSYPYTSNNFYVTNSNNGVANATINGNTLTVYGTAPGYTTVTVCSTAGQQCAPVTVTVIAPYQYQNTGNWYWSHADNCWKQR
ncbi:MAG: hypothetical protein V4478_03945 [Patescibacteria group bacterium]